MKPVLLNRVIYGTGLPALLHTRKSKKKSFIETCTQNEIVFDPQFMVSDAAESYTISKVSNSYE
jgi:hypothetical protein